MNFTDAVRSVVQLNYANFSGRARRSEYWYFVLFNIIISVVAALVDQLLMSVLGFGFIGIIISLGLLIPGIAVGVRRLHDTDRSGWWLLLGLVPLIGFIVLIIWFATEGTKGDNRFGPMV